ncbi:hypothetical protein BKA64DRAFT_738425 [Cadophora sp. MPI-SDFR-AT-0126]|nr:hypothetical protein BKA64DRAFT_738425 [Leotiomycetes sp. MPI-SDFR-AT-0126]
MVTSSHPKQHIHPPSTPNPEVLAANSFANRSKQVDIAMTPRKRRAAEDADQGNNPHESTRKYIKAEIEDEAAEGPSPFFPTVILSGFTWNMDVDVRISRALEMYNPLFLEVSTELPAHENLAIKNRYGIQTDYITVVFGSAKDQERMVKDLDHARFNWTNPYLEVRKVEDSREGNVNAQQPPEHSISNASQILNPEQERREAQSKIWINLTNAITNARTHLFGHDLETFEALIAKPVPGVDPLERVNSWPCEGMPNSQSQRMNTIVQRVKADEDKENVTMDDEMAAMGVTFGRTGSTPWW